MQKLKQFPSLYFILDPSVCKKQNPIKIATEVLKGGVKLLQLRDKNNDIRTKLQLAKKIQTLSKKGIERYKKAKKALDLLMGGLDDSPLIGVKKYQLLPPTIQS